MPTAHPRLAEINGTQTGHVYWDLTFPDVVWETDIRVDAARVSKIAEVIGCDVLSITSEPGIASERHYDANWTIAGLTGSRTADGMADSYRTATSHEAGKDTSWIILNRAEVLDRAQGPGYMQSTLMNRGVQRYEVEAVPLGVEYAKLLNRILMWGLDDLRAERLSPLSLGIVIPNLRANWLNLGELVEV